MMGNISVEKIGGLKIMLRRHFWNFRGEKNIINRLFSHGFGWQLKEICKVITYIDPMLNMETVYC
jgi:hypothetical protein